MLVMVGGAPRGGTQYAADVLTACGLPARREAAFRGVLPTDDRPHLTTRPTDCLAESSYLAVPWFPYFSGVRVLVVRPPLDTIRSQYGSLGFLDDEDSPILLTIFLIFVKRRDCAVMRVSGWTG